MVRSEHHNRLPEEALGRPRVVGLVVKLHLVGPAQGSYVVPRPHPGGWSLSWAFKLL